MQELPEKQWFPMPKMPLTKRQMKTKVLFARVPLKKKQNTIELGERSGVDTMCEHRLSVTISLDVFWLLPWKGFGICAFRCCCMANAGISSIIAGPQSTRKVRYPMLMIDTGQCKNRFFLPFFHLCCDGVLPSFSGGMPLFQRYKDR